MLISTPLKRLDEANTAPRDGEHKPLARDGSENLTGYFPPAVKHQMMELTIERRKATGGKATIQDLMAEALNDFVRQIWQARNRAHSRKEGQGP